jgi:hypothetical protein
MPIAFATFLSHLACRALTDDLVAVLHHENFIGRESYVRLNIGTFPVSSFTQDASCGTQY